MSPQEYFDSIGLGHLRAPVDWAMGSPGAAVTLAPGIMLSVDPDTDAFFGGVWLDIDDDSVGGDTRESAEAALDRLAREADATATRYREALAVLRGEATQCEP
jgi:hypothetical protein